MSPPFDKGGQGGLGDEVARRGTEEGSAERGAGSPESGGGAPGVFGDLTSQAIVGGDPLRLTRVASPKKPGAPAPPRQPPRLRDATVEPIKARRFECRSMRVTGGQIPEGPSSALRLAPNVLGIRPPAARTGDCATRYPIANAASVQRRLHRQSHVRAACALPPAAPGSKVRWQCP